MQKRDFSNVIPGVKLF